MKCPLPLCVSVFKHLLRGSSVVTQRGKGEGKEHSGQLARGSAGLM